MRLWLDDERDPTSEIIQREFGSHGDEVWAKTEAEAIAHLATGKVSFISLDHDLGDDWSAGCGYGVACWLEEKAASQSIPKLAWRVHSQNSVGRNNITRAMESADAFWARDTPFMQADEPGLG